MALSLRKGPERGAGLVGRALRDLSGPADPDALLGGASIALSEPLPLYRLALDQITDRDDLVQAEQVGWRYLIESRGQAAFADLRETADEALRFASLSQNENAGRLIEAAHLCEVQAAGRAEIYEPRILEIPSLNTSALWLLDGDGRSVFIPFIDMKRLKGGPVQVEDDFLDDVVRRAKQARTLHGEPSPPEPTPQWRMGG